VGEGLLVGGVGALEGATDLVGAEVLGALFVGAAVGETVTLLWQKSHETGHASLTGLPLFQVSQYLVVLTPSTPPRSQSQSLSSPFFLSIK
jgi:hypothetical protein